MEKIKNGRRKGILIIILLGLFVGFLFFLFAWLLNMNSFEGCTTKYIMNIYSKITNNINETSLKIDNSQVLIVGDSRMEFIEDDESVIKPFNFNFIAKSGMTIKWFKNAAIPKVNRFLEKEDNIKYHVIVNMGVNDLNKDKISGDDVAGDYFKFYSELAENYPEIKFYILAINPIDEERINEWDNNKRTSRKVRLFNKTIQKELKESNLDNMFYCDSYHDLDFESKDGLHYTPKTNQKIVNYIANKCVQF